MSVALEILISELSTRLLMTRKTNFSTFQFSDKSHSGISEDIQSHNFASKVYTP